MKTLQERVIWLSGVLDGEGHVSVTLQSRRHVPRKDGTPGSAIYAEVGVTNTDETMIAEVSAIARELGISFNVRFCGRRRDGIDKPCWQIVFTGFKRTEAILKVLLPYLVVKKGRAELLLQIIRHRKATMNPSGGLGPRTHPEADAWLMSALGDLKHLNRRGPAPVEERI